VLGAVAHEHRDVGGHLVIARAGGVEAPAHRSGQLREPALDGHVHVLVVGMDLEASALDLLGDPVEALEQDRDVVLGEDAPRAQHPRVGARLREVVLRQAEVVGDRGVQRPEELVLRLREARHGAAV